MSGNDEYGPLVSRWQVEQAVLNTLQQPPANDVTYPRVVYYLAEVERMNGLAPRTIPLPPGANSYRGGADFDTMQAEWFPMIHVVANPVGNAEAVDPATYGQAYQVQVAATVGDDDEDTARMYADHYGIAITGCLLQKGSLGGISSSTILERMPNTELLASGARQVARSVMEFTTTVVATVGTSGPTSWPDDPYDDAPVWPVVNEVNVTLTAKPID